MSCPYFLPEEPLENRGWLSLPRMPLGEVFDGICTAPGDLPPSETHLQDVCNCGYARGRCSRFPAECSADAVRFSLSAEVQGLVPLTYVLESDHVPLRHGLLEFDLAAGHFRGELEDPVLMRQARAVIESYLRRKKKNEAARAAGG